MDGACHHPLAGTGLAHQKHRRIQGRHLLNPEEDIRNGAALANDLAEVVFTVSILLQADVLGLKPVF